MYFITYTLLAVLGFGYLSAEMPTPTAREAITQIRTLPDINKVIRDPEAIEGPLLCLLLPCHHSSTTALPVSSATAPPAASYGAARP